jgi:hypothetical protein
MKRNKDNHLESENSSDSLSVVKAAIDLSVQKEYFNYSNSIDFSNIDYKKVFKEDSKLFSDNTPREMKKRILILLAHFGTAESYRILEKYLKSSEQPLKDWALLSLKECRMFFESALLEEEGGIVSTGLGGKDNKLRYYFIVSSKKSLTFSETDRNILNAVFEAISQKHNSEIEEINFETNCAMIKILVPLDVAVGDIIEEGINQCNETKELLFFITMLQMLGRLQTRKSHNILRELAMENNKASLQRTFIWKSTII